MNEYQRFSTYYDKLMAADYHSYFAYVEEIFKRTQKAPEIVLDLCCGTGNLTILLAEKGYDMIGLDLSETMLAEAMNKCGGNNQKILFLNADMRTFELYGTVSAVICSFDGINHLLTPEDVLCCFKRVALFLEPGGVFLFDLNTEHKLKNVLGGNTFLYDVPEVFCAWQTDFSEKKHLAEFNLTFFEKTGEKYLRYDETYYERAYSLEEIKSLLKKAGFLDPEVFGEFSFEKPKEDAERVFFVTRKPEENLKK